jgi:formylglycine-generating enzyme required for sulfatase activity
VTFDPYYKWLGIPPEEQPAHSYRLLGIRLFEDDPDVISNAADQRMAHLRTHQTGAHGALSQRLLNEVAAARVCLLHPAKKARYDAALREKLAASDPTSSQNLQNVLAQLTDESRRALAGRRRPQQMPRWVIALMAVVVVVAGLLVAVPALQRRSDEVAKIEVPAVVESRSPVPPQPPKLEPEPAKPVAKPEPKAVPAPEAKPESKPTPQPELKPAPKPESKPEPKPVPPPGPVAPAVAKPEPEAPDAGPELAAKLDELKQLSRGAVPATRRKIFEQAVALTKAAVAADQYAVALDTGKLATMEASRLRDRDLLKQARAALQEAQQREKAFAAVRAAKERLATQPDDAEANLAFGKFLCFAKGDWHRGLPRLARVQDAALGKLAARDVAETNQPAEQVALGDAWWEAANAETTAARKSILLHAAMWYYRASFQLTGTAKSVAEKRIQQAGLETQITNPTDGSVLVLIPEGKFLAGEHKQESYLPAYYLGMHEVSRFQYERFVKATGHAPPTTMEGNPWNWPATGFRGQAGEQPAGCIQWKEADEYCLWAGLRLPTATEWEKGARGLDGRTYPWGDNWDPAKCQNTHTRRTSTTTCTVSSYPEARSPWGLYNTVGNVWEWCADRVEQGAIRCGGGCELGGAENFTCWSRSARPLETRALEYGFRVSRDFRP